MANRTKLTAKKRKAFIDFLREHEANVTRAAESVGISRRHMYELRDACAEFAAEWDAAVEDALDEVEQSLWVDAKTGKDTTGRIFLLKSRRPDVFNPPQKIAPTDPSGTKPFSIQLPEDWPKGESEG